MKRLFILTVMVCTVPVLWAQTTIKAHSFEVASLSEKNVPSFVIFKSCAPAVSELDSWFRSNLDADKNFHLRLIRNTKDAAGNPHMRFGQYYKDIPVEDLVANIHLKDGKVHSLNGNYYPRLAVPIIAAINEQEALVRALKLFPPDAIFAWQRPFYESLLKQTTHNPDASHRPLAQMVIVERENSELIADYRYAYRFDIYTIVPLSRKIVYVDAMDGAVISVKEMLHEIDVVGKAYTRYSGEQSITCHHEWRGDYLLVESRKGTGIVTLNGKKLVTGGDPEEFRDADNEWDNVNPDQDEFATDLHWGLEKTYDYFSEVIGRNSINDAGYDLVGVAHIAITPGEKMPNAFWNGSYAFFGDGNDTSMNPLTSVDIVGHEITHGLTQMTAGLNYKNEAGALNESFSDIFGKNIERYASPGSYNWEIGKATMLPGKSCLRSMKDPNSKKDPKYYKGLYYFTGSDDNGGVHVNSAVQNFWYYLLCDGGSGTREGDLQPYSVNSIGCNKATQVVYSNLLNYLTPTSKYSDAAIGAVEAAKLLFGASSEEVAQIRMAWYAVGLMDKPADTATETGDYPYNATLQVYPNPADQYCTIMAGRPFCDATASLFTIAGQLVQKSENLKGASLSLDIADLTPGLYLLEIKDNSSVYRTRLVKQ